MVAIARKPLTNSPLSIVLHLGARLRTAFSFTIVVEASMPPSIDNAGEERNCCFDRRISHWPRCRDDQQAHWETTEAPDGAGLAQPSDATGIDAAPVHLGQNTSELPMVAMPPHTNRPKVIQQG